jgi:hypothetical protein
MSKTYIGYEGHYDIEDDGKIIQRMVNRFGQLTGFTKIYNDAKKIPNLFDRDGIENLLQLMNIYRYVGRV